MIRKLIAVAVLVVTMPLVVLADHDPDHPAGGSHPSPVPVSTTTTTIVEPEPVDWTCVQSDGQTGVFINGQGSSDDQCLTADEYSETVEVEALLEEGIISDAADNGDGTVTISFPRTGGQHTIASDPLDRPVSANPEWEPDAPTVRQVLFSSTGTAFPI